MIGVGALLRRALAGPRCGITRSCWAALVHRGFVLARIRLTRTAAERGPVLSGERGQENGFQTLVVKVPFMFEPPQ